MMVDLVKSQQDKDIVNFMATLAPIGRGLAFPPGVPQRFVKALRKAFDAAVHDPTFRKDAESRRLRVNPLTGEEVQKIVNDVLKISPATVKRARKLIMG